MQKSPNVDTRYVMKTGKVTPLLRSSVKEVLKDYVSTAKFWAQKRQKPLSDYQLKEAHIAGSILEGNDESDLDLLFIANKIDDEDYRFMKIVMAQRYFNNRNKFDAVDVFVRPYDAYPEKNSFDVTGQLEKMLNKFNDQLKD